MKQLDKYNKILKEIYTYFDFEEDWTVYPIDDRRNYWWYIDAHSVWFFDSKEAYENEDDNHTYSNELLSSRFYDKKIFKKNDFTLIMVDTQTDNNKFLAIYDNTKKL